MGRDQGCCVQIARHWVVGQRVVDHSGSKHSVGVEHQDEGDFLKWLKWVHDWEPGRIAIHPVFAINLLRSTAKLEVRPFCNLTKKVSEERFSIINNVNTCACPDESR